MDTSGKVSIQDEYDSDGKFNFAYVESRNAIIPMYLLAKINPNWDIEKQSDYKIDEADTIKELNFRDQLDLKSSIQNATISAYTLAGKEVNVTSTDHYIVYLKDKMKTDLKVSDQVVKVENQEISNIEDVRSVVREKEVGDKVELTVLRDNKEVDCYATVFEEEGVKIIGMSITSIHTYETDPKATIHFRNNESGPSGGLMLGLTIYNKLTEEDLTNGLNIVGTGTIDSEGKIGAIGGVKYKLAGAVKAKADVFIVPNEENYDECMKLKKEKGYSITIIGVDTLEDAIQKLKELN